MPEKGYKHSEETRRKIADAHLGKTQTLETRQKIGISVKARMTDERRQLLSTSAKGRVYDETTRIDMSEKKKAWWAAQKAARH